MEQKVASSKTPVKNKKTKAIANKRIMNFARHESSIDLKKLAIILVVVAIVGGVFAKFAILDQLAKKTQAYSDLATAQDQLAAMNIRLSKYKEVKDEYDRYSMGRMDEEEVSTLERTTMLNIIESIIMEDAQVSQISASGNVAEVVIHGINLEQASVLVTALEKEEFVADALVSFAESDFSAASEVHMTIYMRKVVE